MSYLECTAVVIGFQDNSTSVDMTEGGSARICAEVKQFGLELDPFDSVPLDLMTVQGIYSYSILWYRMTTVIHTTLLCMVKEVEYHWGQTLFHSRLPTLYAVQLSPSLITVKWMEHAQHK